MSTRTTAVISVLLIALSVIAGIVLYPELPDPMPSHWNAAGEVDGYMSKFWGVFLVPLLSAGLLAMLLAIPSMDPRRANIEKFRGAYNAFIVGFVAFMVYVEALILAAGLGHTINMTRLLMPVVGLLFVGVGVMVGRAKRNYFIGIRTPWTLDDEVVWDATHRLGAWTFGAAGVLVLLGSFLGSGTAVFWLMLAALLLAAVVPIVYSYVLWRRRHPDGSPQVHVPPEGDPR